ncbi:hypothetical protein MC7420_2548 [Coleofasciculus chthonoplastes PCC 7420]|uniref:Uncharacterized protein n=1 Tax=Coleofasciculus chthonoplastes PCC 7420 TaxID=118168 RepID=B4VYN2_9CYAN|nr:hypothetical protein MC7420_2548 [Coleofasciculus chthonoplastes PCC 7420]
MAALPSDANKPLGLAFISFFQTETGGSTLIPGSLAIKLMDERLCCF